jgi:hypothetical protein
VWTVLRELGVSVSTVVDEMRRRGVGTPDFNPDEDRPWRGHHEVEVAKSEWQDVVDVLTKKVRPSSGLRWGFNSRRDRPGKIQFASDGIDLDAIVAEARPQGPERITSIAI